MAKRPHSRPPRRRGRRGASAAARTSRGGTTSRTATGALATTAQPMELGQGFQGSLDEVRIYRRALSAAEIASDRGTPIDSAAPFSVTYLTPASGVLGVLTTPVTAMFSRSALA